MSRKPHNTDDRRYMIFAMRIVGEFGVVIAAPVILFVFLGQYLDHRWGTTPRLTVLSFLLAALLSGAVMYKKSKAYGKEFASLDSDKEHRVK